MYWPFGGLTTGPTCPAVGSTSTLTSTPASAELVWVVLVMVTSVRRPMTIEGRMTNTLPLPLLVFIPAAKLPTQSPVCAVHPVLSQVCWQIWPPVIVPLLLSTQLSFAPWLLYVKLPLLWAKTAPEVKVKERVTTSARLVINNTFLISRSPCSVLIPPWEPHSLKAASPRVQRDPTSCVCTTAEETGRDEHSSLRAHPGEGCSGTSPTPRCHQ